MKRTVIITAIAAAFLNIFSVQAQNSDAVNTAATDSVTYTETGNRFYEHLWRNGEIYHSRELAHGTILDIDWQKKSNIVFAKGVTMTSGWYDVNKKKDGRTGEDGNMCWAAAAANMLEWWQDRYKEIYGTLPEGAISGGGKKYELAIFEQYQKDWDNYYGSEVYYAIPWYLNGEDRTANAVYVGKPHPGTGGFYAAQWPELQNLMEQNYTYEVNGYGTWGDGWGVDTSRDPLEIFTEHIVDAFEHGMASISITIGVSMMHTVTMWGYELDDNGLVKKIFVTDSDNQLKKPKEPRMPIIHEYEVVVRNGRDIGIVGSYDGYNLITQIVPFKGLLKTKPVSE